MTGLQLDLFAAAEATFTPPRPRPAEPPKSTAGTVADGPTSVVCLRGRQRDPAIRDVVYVGRPQFQGGWRLHGHVLSNPFKLGRDGDAATVVAKYEAWLAEHPQLLDRELPRLRGRILGCWCPEGAPCHARVLAALADCHGGRMPIPEALAAWAAPRGLAVLDGHPDPVGEHNDAVLDLFAAQQVPVIAGWGAGTTAGGRDTAVAQQLDARGVRLHCLGTTKGGHPRHPLYLPAAAPLQPWPADPAVDGELVGGDA